MKRVFIPLIFALSAAMARAQMFMAEPRWDLPTLQSPIVAKELKLTEAQSATLQEKLAKATDGGMKIEIHGGEDPQEAIKRQVDEFDTKIRQVLKATLTKEQFTRIEQVNRQAKGISALLWSDSQKALDLTESQIGQLEELKQENNKKHMEIMQAYIEVAGPGEHRVNMDAEGAAKVRKVGLEYAVKGLAVLTEVQKKKWTDLTGAPVDFAPKK